MLFHKGVKILSNENIFFSVHYGNQNSVELKLIKDICPAGSIACVSLPIHTTVNQVFQNFK